MARPEKIALEVPAAAAGGAGRAEHVFRFRDKTVQVTGQFQATLQLEGKLADDEYAPLGPPITAPGLYAIPFTIEFLRVRTVNVTSGAPAAVFGGLDFRAY
jgi:hypothetical protein